jgi:hypothetical protein
MQSKESALAEIMRKRRGGDIDETPISQKRARRESEESASAVSPVPLSRTSSAGKEAAVWCR